MKKASCAKSSGKLKGFLPRPPPAGSAHEPDLCLIEAGS